MPGDTDEFTLVCETLRKLNLVEYEQSFRDHEMNDEVVKVCLTDEKMMPFLKSLIPKLGQQVLFARNFLARGTAMGKPEEGRQQKPAGSGLNCKPGQVQDHVAATEIAVEMISTAPLQVKAEEKQDLLREKKWDLAQAKALRVFKATITEDLDDREDYLDDAELKELLNEGIEAAKKTLQKSAPEKPSQEELKAQFVVLQASLDQESQNFRDSNKRKWKEMEAKLEAKVDDMCTTLMDRIKQKFDKVPMDLDEIVEYAHDEAYEITIGFDRQYGDWKCYDGEKLQAKIEDKFTSLLEDLKERDDLLDSKVEDLFIKAVTVYQKEIRRANLKYEKLEYLRLNERLVTQVQQFLEAENLDECSKAICRKIVERKKFLIDHVASNLTEAMVEHTVSSFCIGINEKALEVYDAKWKARVRNSAALTDATLRSYHAACKQDGMKCHHRTAHVWQTLFGLDDFDFAELWKTAERIMDTRFEQYQKNKKKTTQHKI